MIDISKAKFLHVIYPPLTGGNHIINLLTTADTIRSKIDTDKLVEFYKTKTNFTPNTPKASDDSFRNSFQIDSNYDLISQGYNVHVYESNNLFKFIYRNVQNYTSDKICTLVHGHSDEYKFHLGNTTLRNNFFKYLPYTLGLFVSVPKILESRLYKRVKYFNENNSYVVPLSNNNYHLPFSIVGYEIFNNTNACILDSDIFGQTEGSKYFQEFVLEKFNIKLPNTIHVMHELWINMVDQSLANK